MTAEWPLWQAPPPPAPPRTAWLQRTAVTGIHLCHRPTVGLMSSPAQPLKHSTWAGPGARGLPPNLRKVSGRPDPGGAGVHGACPNWGPRAPPGRPRREDAPGPGSEGAGGHLPPIRPEPSLALLGFSLSDSSDTGSFPLNLGATASWTVSPCCLILRRVGAGARMLGGLRRGHTRCPWAFSPKAPRPCSSGHLVHRPGPAAESVRGSKDRCLRKSRGVVQVRGLRTRKTAEPRCSQLRGLPRPLVGQPRASQLAAARTAPPRVPPSPQEEALGLLRQRLASGAGTSLPEAPQPPRPRVGAALPPPRRSRPRSFCCAGSLLLVPTHQVTQEASVEQRDRKGSRDVEDGVGRLCSVRVWEEKVKA